MTLFQSWADSLTLLKPKNFQLFVMVTIKSILEAYKLYFKYFWWLLLVMPLFLFVAPDFVVAHYVEKHNGSVTLAYYLTLLGIATSLYGILFLAACFLTRPSILQKDCSYLRTEFKKIIVYWFLWGFVWMLLIKYNIFLRKMLFFLFAPVSSRSPELILFTLFFADSDGGLKNIFVSLWNSFKMFVYNLPLFMVMILCFSVPVVFFGKLFYISPLMKIVIESFLMPIGVCTYTNIYIKRLHDQFDLYFKQPQ
jgi:hypothetical protein